MRRARLSSVAILAAALAPSAFAAPRLFIVDGYNAKLSFSCDILGMMPVEGTFTRFFAVVALDEQAPGDARAVVRVDANSMTLQPADWAADLMGPDFFDVTRFPEFGFTSYSAVLIEPGLIRLDGKLTLRGITKPLSLLVRYNIDDKRGIASARIEADAEVDRTEYGMTAYDALLSDDVAIEVDGRMTQGFLPMLGDGG